MSGRPQNNPKKYKVRKSYHLPGRYKERLDALHAKKQKLEMLSALLYSHEHAAVPDLDEIKAIKKRANEVRAQLAVLSTVEPDDYNPLNTK